jgi:hypothetical protein
LDIAFLGNAFQLGIQALHLSLVIVHFCRSASGAL